MRRTSRSLTVALTAVLFLVGAPARVAVAGPPPAVDASLEEAKLAFEQAEKDYNLGRFAEAKKNYERAFEKKAAPALLYNIAQCERKLGDFANATFHYQRYLDQTPKAKNRAQVLQLIEQTRKQAEEAAMRKPAPNGATGTAGTTPTGSGEPPSNGGTTLATPNTAAVTTTTPSTSTTATNPAGPAGSTSTASVVVASTETPPATKPGGDATLSKIPREAIVAPPDGDAPASTTTPVYKKWWLWTIVGVAVVGGGAGITAAALNPSHSTDAYNDTTFGPVNAVH